MARRRRGSCILDNIPNLGSLASMPTTHPLLASVHAAEAVIQRRAGKLLAFRVDIAPLARKLHAALFLPRDKGFREAGRSSEGRIYTTCATMAQAEANDIIAGPERWPSGRRRLTRNFVKTMRRVNRLR